MPQVAVVVDTGQLYSLCLFLTRPVVLISYNLFDSKGEIIDSFLARIRYNNIISKKGKNELSTGWKYLFRFQIKFYSIEYFSGGMAQVVQLLGSIPGVSHKLRILWIIIPACLIKQPNGTLSRMYVQTYISVK